MLTAFSNMSCNIATIGLFAAGPENNFTFSPRTRQTLLPQQDFPKIPLATRNKGELRSLLRYADLEQSADTPAEKWSHSTFRIARHFAQHTRFQQIAFDWDHTLSNNQIFEDLPTLVRVKLSSYFPGKHAHLPLTALEMPRPFMLELAFGLMVGFALRQGLTHFDQWAHYTPQVGIMTHTWPDRVAVLADHFIPLLSLMEAVRPGTPDLGDRIRNHETRAFIHLHHFLDYAIRLLNKVKEVGVTRLSDLEYQELYRYFKDGKAHHRKPLSAVAEFGWELSSFLLFEDAPQIIEDVRDDAPLTGAASLFVPNPYRPRGTAVKETDKVLSGDLLRELFIGSARSRPRKRTIAAQRLMTVEQNNSAIPELLNILQRKDADPIILTAQAGDLRIAYNYNTEMWTLPAGYRFVGYETSTRMYLFWNEYVGPCNQLKTRIKRLKEWLGDFSKLHDPKKENRI